MGEFDLMRLAFVLDVGLYTMGVASQPFKRGTVALTEPVFSTRPSVPFFYLMRAYNRRFSKISAARCERNASGRCNDCHRFMFQGYTFAPPSAVHIARGIAAWGWLELKEGWRSWFRSANAKLQIPEPVPILPPPFERSEPADREVQAAP